MTIGSLTVTRYGMGCALAMCAVLLGVTVWCKYFSLRYSFRVRFAVLAIPLCWFWSRLGFVAANIAYYIRTLHSVEPLLYFWDGGYSMLGALVGLVIAGRRAERWCHLPRYALRDALSLGLPLGVMVERFFEAGTGMGLGRPVETAFFRRWAVPNDLGVMVHPVYAYECIAAGCILLAIVIWMSVRHWYCPEPGDALLIFLVLYGCSQVVLESLRMDNHLVVHFVHIQQIGAAVLPVIALAHWTKRARQKGCGKRQLLTAWALVVVGITLATVLEFAFDTSEHLLRDYTLMVLCMAMVGASTLWTRRMANRS